jgi:hypothetical protein
MLFNACACTKIDQPDVEVKMVPFSSSIWAIQVYYLYFVFLWQASIHEDQWKE